MGRGAYLQPLLYALAAEQLLGGKVECGRLFYCTQRGGYEDFELNLTERLFAAKLGVKPLFFRPPYSIDEEPDVDEQVRPLEIVQDMGYITVGEKIDPNDWRDHPRYSAEEITAFLRNSSGGSKVRSSSRRFAISTWSLMAWRVTLDGPVLTFVGVSI